MEGLNVSEEKAIQIRGTVMARVRIDLHYNDQTPVTTVAGVLQDTNDQSKERTKANRRRVQSIFANPGEDAELVDDGDDL